MAAELVKFSGEIGVSSAVVLDGIEDRDAVGGDGDGSAEEAGFCGEWCICGVWVEGKSPGVRAVIELGKGHLLLPRYDSGHELVIGHAI